MRSWRMLLLIPISGLEKATLVKAIGSIDNEVLNNLVTHVAQLTKQLSRQQGTANAIQTNP